MKNCIFSVREWFCFFKNSFFSSGSSAGSVHENVMIEELRI